MALAVGANRRVAVHHERGAGSEPHGAAHLEPGAGGDANASRCDNHAVKLERPGDVEQSADQQHPLAARGAADHEIAGTPGARERWHAAREQRPGGRRTGGDQAIGELRHRRRWRVQRDARRRRDPRPLRGQPAVHDRGIPGRRHRRDGRGRGSPRVRAIEGERAANRAEAPRLGEPEQGGRIGRRRPSDDTSHEPPARARDGGDVGQDAGR